MARFCHASNEDPDQTAHAHLSTILEKLQFLTLQFIYTGKEEFVSHIMSYTQHNRYVCNTGRGKLNVFKQQEPV